MRAFIERNPVWSLVLLLLLAGFFWLLFALWPDGLRDFLRYEVGESWIGGDTGRTFGRDLANKKVFVNALLLGITQAALLFLVAAGFTLIFGLMRNVNLAHGSLYLFGGYIGWEFAELTGYWLLAFPAAFLASAILGILLQLLIFRRMQGDDLRQTLVTIALAVIAADLMLAYFGGNPVDIDAPSWLSGPMETVFSQGYERERIRVSGWLDAPTESIAFENVYRERRSVFVHTGINYVTFPIIRLVILLAAIALGIAMWLILTRTRIGMLIRAGVDDREMLQASGVPIQLVFAGVFAFGAGLAGMAGVVGGTFRSIGPGEDTTVLLDSLIVVVVGGLGSIPGAALGALVIGLADQFASSYAQTYALVIKFLIMVLVLAFRPRGLLGGR